MAHKLLNRRQLLAVLRDEHGVDICQMTLRRWIKQGIFPPPAKISPGIEGWKSNVPGEWFESRFGPGQVAA
jgi:predicted DNA-binding transcriptional regulator AlpA